MKRTSSEMHHLDWMKLVVDVSLLYNVHTKDEKEKKQTLFRFMIFKSLRGG